MSTLGTIALALAVPVYLLVLHALFSIPRPSGSAQAVPEGTILATLALGTLWVFLAIALASATLSGRFDWVAKARPIQFLLIFSAHLSTGFVTWASILRRHHPSTTVPVCLRPIAPWAAFVLPPIVLLGALFALYPPLGYVVSPEWQRGTLGTVGGLSILATGGLLIEGWLRRSRPPSP